MCESDIARDPTATKVVVVSDDPEVCDLLAALLRANGFPVEISSRAEFATGSPHSALVLVLRECRKPRGGRAGLRFPGAELLTTREIDVLAQIAAGASSEEAA
jgi:CheY-like chemotaxis protein